MADERKSALDAALGQIERQFGKGAIMRMGDDARVPVAAISTGALSLDLALGVGGVPRGRIVELYGPESSGKTTLCYHIMAEAQKAGGTCAFIDAEHSMDPVYASRIGLNVDELLVSQPDNGEQALEIVEVLVRSGALDQARLMSQAMRKLAGTLNRTGTICLFTNQIREKIGVMFGSPETQPGGRALKFYASVRMDIRRIETLKDGSDAYGNRVRVKVVKNKVAPPFRQAEFDVIYGDGISWEGSVLDVGIEQNVISKSGSFLSFGETRLGQGRERAKAFLREHPDILQAVLDKIQEGLEGVVVPGASLPAPGMAIGEVPPEVPPSAEVEAASVNGVVAG
jgi:recombination protein RecA